jgi:hypothetical protein
MAGSRKGWAQLSPTYKARLTRQGITPQLYRSGADLRGARGKLGASSRPATAAPKEQTDQTVTGGGTDESQRILERWRSTTAPAWLPASNELLGTDVVAALSQLPSPRSWGNVHFIPSGGGQPWVMQVDIKGGYQREIVIPGGSDARDVLHLLSSPEWFDLDDYDDWDSWIDQYDYDVGDSG